jgi:hypothetical protein
MAHPGAVNRQVGYDRRSQGVFNPLRCSTPIRATSLSNDNVDARSMATRIKKERDMGAFRVSEDELSSQE